MSQLSDYVKAGLIMLGAVGVIWFFMIRPYTYDWQPAGETTGTVKTLMSNSNVIGGAYINAVVTLEGGRETIIRIPMNDNIRAGREVTLRIDVDAKNTERKRYEFHSVPAQN